MVKTLRITSIIAAALATFLIVFPAVFGVGSNKEIEKFLKSPGAVESSKKAAGAKTSKDSDSQTSPLVTSAEAFALYLNPPKPKEETKPGPTSPEPSIKPRPMGAVSPKFKLIGTSFYASHPELSLALIDEPATGLRWVRQSSEVGHLVIEQVKDGLVVARDGTSTLEIPVVERPPMINLLKGASSDAADSKSASENVLPEVTTGMLPQLDAEQSKALDELVDQLRALQSSTEPNSPDSNDSEAKMEALNKVVSELKSSRISDAEAEKLGNLGKELKGHRRPRSSRNIKNNTLKSDPNQAKGGKIEASTPDEQQASLPEPNSPTEE